MSNSNKLPGKAQGKKQSTLETLYNKFSAIPIEVLRNPDISPGAKIVFVELMSYGWFVDQPATAGQDRMMYELGIKDKATFRKYLNELRSHGLISFEQETHQGTNHTKLRPVSAKLKKQYAKYSEKCKEYREDKTGLVQKPWLLEKVSGKTTIQVSGKTTNQVSEKTTNKINEGELNKEEINEDILFIGSRRGETNVIDEVVHSSFASPGVLSSSTSAGSSPSPDIFLPLGTSSGKIEDVEHDMYSVDSKRLLTEQESYFFRAWQQFQGKPYQWPQDINEDVLEDLRRNELLEDMVRIYFTSSFKHKVNYRVKHFLTPGVQSILDERLRCSSLTNNQWAAINGNISI